MNISFARIALAILFCTSMVGCSSQRNNSTSSNVDKPEVVDTGYYLTLDKNLPESKNTIQTNEEHPENISLADMLRKLAGVIVTGNGNNVNVRIGGISSFGNTDPLYVLNGNAIGTDYAQVAGTINTNEITSLRVLKGSEAAIYGSRGGNGVILIRTNKKR